MKYLRNFYVKNILIVYQKDKKFFDLSTWSLYNQKGYLPKTFKEHKDWQIDVNTTIK